MKHFPIKALLNLTAVTTSVVGGLIFNTVSAQALTWTFGAGSTTADPFPITGSFTIDDESAASPMVTFASVTVASPAPGGPDVFTAADVASIIGGGGLGVSSITFDQLIGTNSLILDFSPANLTVSGGTVALGAGSSYSSLDSAPPVIGSPVSGSVSAPITGGGPGASVIPFNFSSLPGLMALGLIVGGNYAYKKFKA